MNESLQPLLTLLTHKAAWLAGILPSVMVISRLVMKWFNGPLQQRLTAMLAAAATSPDAEEQQDWETVLRKRWYRILNFTLDLVFSIKLPVLADFLRLKAQGKQPNTPAPETGASKEGADMKKIIGCIAIIGGLAAALLAPVTFTGCTTVQTGTSTNGVPTYITLLDTNAVVAGINAVVPTAVKVACQQDANAKPYFQQAVLIMQASYASGAVDPAVIRASLSNISIRELRTDQAVIAEEAGLAIYQAFAAQVVSAQMDKVTWLKPVLSALAAGIQAGLPPN